MKNKDKYNLEHLHIVEYAEKNILSINVTYVEIKYNGKIVKEYACTNEAGIKKFLEWLEEDDEKECKPTILTGKEKAYLSAVIKPFREEVKCINKAYQDIVNHITYIRVDMLNRDFISLPLFEKEKMYTGMECEKEYTLEELGL